MDSQRNPFKNVKLHNFNFSLKSTISVFFSQTFIPPEICGALLVYSIVGYLIFITPFFTYFPPKWGIISLSIFPCFPTFLPSSTFIISPLISHIGQWGWDTKGMPFHLCQKRISLKGNENQQAPRRRKGAREGKCDNEKKKVRVTERVPLMCQ